MLLIRVAYPLRNISSQCQMMDHGILSNWTFETKRVTLAVLVSTSISLIKNSPIWFINRTMSPTFGTYLPWELSNHNRCKSCLFTVSSAMPEIIVQTTDVHDESRSLSRCSVNNPHSGH